jgi:4-amino-4-deoxy-L-arabinose transferase-like glycosyltransferase
MRPARLEGVGGDDSRVAPPTRRLIELTLLATLIVRSLALVARLPELTADPDGYRQFAQTLVERGVLGPGRPSAYRPPLYPLLLAPCVAAGENAELAIGALHVALGVITAGLVIWLGNLWGLGRRSLLAGGLVACDPILVHQSTVVMTETAATCLAAASLVALTLLGRRPALGTVMVAGLVMALAALCRPTFLPWAACVPLVVLWQVPGLWSRRLLLAGGFCIALLAGLAPWMVRNQLHFGRPIATTTHGGYTLFLANNRSFYRWLREDAPLSAWEVTPPMQAAIDKSAPPMNDELARDELFYDLAWQAIRDEPGMFAWSCLVRIGYLWRPLPQKTVLDESRRTLAERWIVAGWYLAVYLLAVCGVWRLGKRVIRLPWFWGLALVASVTLIHTFYWSNMRMRAPAAPVVALMAAAGCGWIAGRMVKRSVPA